MEERITIPTDQLARCVLPMYAVTPHAVWHGIGTGFVIGVLDERTALIVTAAHNLRGLEGLPSFERRPRSHASTPVDFTAHAEKTWRDLDVQLLFLLSGAEQLVAATVLGDSQLLEHDLAIVRAMLPEGSPTRFDMVLPVDFDPRIAPGTHVAAVGYAGLGATSTQDFDRSQFTATATFTLSSRDGRVLGSAPAEGIHRGRAGVIVDIPFDGGMSGGPLIELRGSTPVARAIVSADVSEEASQGSKGSGAHAVGSLLLPIAGLRVYGVALPLSDGLQTNDPSIYDLLTAGVVKHHGSFNPQLTTDETSPRLTVTWSAAE